LTNCDFRDFSGIMIGDTGTVEFDPGEVVVDDYFSLFILAGNVSGLVSILIMNSGSEERGYGVEREREREKRERERERERLSKRARRE
jgi:hypothetical protein